MELAVCLPILMIIAFGSIEATNAIFLAQHCTSAAYEAARSATSPGRTASEAAAAADAVLTQFGHAGGAVTITPTVNASTATGTLVTVKVSVPFRENSWLTPIVLQRALSNIEATVVMVHQ